MSKFVMEERAEFGKAAALQAFYVSAMNGLSFLKLL